MSDWDAAKYHRVSDPQLAWGRTVASRLELVPGERLLDLGCGTGRLTMELAQKSGIRVVGLDRSAAMLKEARKGGPAPAVALPTGVQANVRGQTPIYVLADGARLPFTNAFDAVFSAAVFHWIADHDALFQSIHTALKPGGRLVAQCGGAKNLDRLYGRARALMDSPPYQRYFSGWTNFNHFENVHDTERRLVRAGFIDIDVSLVSSPVPFKDAESFTEFVAAVCLRHHLDRLPAGDREPFLRRIVEQSADDDAPLTLDYWRLNIFGRKPGA